MNMFLFLLLIQDPSSWVEQLGSGQDAGRWEAVENLSRLGAEGEKIIGGCTDDWWRDIALAEWNARRISGNSYPKVLRISLGIREGEGARLAAELAEKAGIILERRTLTAGEISLDRVEGTWFELLGELGRKAELDIVENYGGMYRIVPGKPGSPFRSLSRNYEVRLTSYIRATHATFKEPPFGQTSFQFSIRPDPKSRILSVKSASLVRGILDTGGELRQVDLTQKSEESRQRYRDMAAHTFEIAFESPDPEGKSIELLRGSVQAVLPAETVTFEIRPRFNGKKIEEEKEGVTVVVDKLSYRQRRVVLSLSIRSSHPGTVFPREDQIQVLDDVGLPYRSYKRTSRSVGSSGMKYEATYLNVTNLGDPRSINISVVTKTFERPVYFSFRDVDLE